MKLIKTLRNKQIEDKKRHLKQNGRSFRRGFALGACAAGCGCLLYLHRNVMKAAMKGDPMPEPPKWHFWCRTKKYGNGEDRP